MNLKAPLEGLLFISGDEGLTKEQITKVLEIDEQTLEKLIQELKQDYSSQTKGLTIEYLGGKLKMITKKQYSNYYKKLFSSEENNTLSPSALETLAIIAYNEPITRITVDEIRGINSSYIIRKLLFMNLIKEVGRSEMPGKPILYGITSEFLDYFGINSTDELPKITIEETQIETDLFETKYKDI